MKNEHATAPTGAVESEPCTSGPGTEGDAFCGQHSTHEASITSTTSRARARKTFIGLLLAAATVAVALVLPAVAHASGPQLTTGFSDYMPGGIVDVHGTGFEANTTYAMPVMRPDTSIVIVDPWTHFGTPGFQYTTSDAAGNLNYNYQLDGIFGTYESRAYSADWLLDPANDGSNAGWSESPLASVTFTDANPSANIDQCGNGPLASPTGCDPATWQNGNLNEQQSHYFEGDSVPYRLRFSDLSVGPAHTVVIAWDTTQSSKHAIDYLTSFGRTVTTADPCAGVAGCSGPPSTAPIPSDPNLSAANGFTGSQIGGDFSIYGGTIAGPGSISAYELRKDNKCFTSPSGIIPNFAADANTITCVKVTFTALNDHPVLAWGGHIGARANWGLNNSAVAISGSPFHMRLIDLDGSGGNQDKSLAAAAVIFPGQLTVVKQASPEGSTSFPFTASPTPLTNFSLVDDGTAANTKLFNNITTFQTYTVGETVPNGWTLDSLGCVVDPLTANGGSTSTANPQASVALKEGEFWTCTFNDSRNTGQLEVVKSLSPTNDPGRFNLQIDGATQKTDAANGDTTGKKTVTTGNHTVGEIAGSVGVLGTYQKSIVCKDQGGAGSTVASVGPDSAGPLTVNVTANSDIVCTVSNVRETGKLEVVKSLSPTNDPGRFNLQIDGATQKTDAANGDSTGEKTVNTGLHNVGEIAGSVGVLGNYQKSIECKDQNGTGSVVASVGADSAGPLDVTVGYQDDIVCTVSNVRETGKLEVVKSLSPTNDPGRFNLQIDGATQKTDAANGDSTGEKTVNTGLHNVGEIAGSVGVLGNYQKSIECKDQNGTGSVVASVGADSAGPLDVTVGYQDDIVCTVSNVRETGKLEVVKSLSPTNDPGRFNLQIDGATQKTDAANGDSTGEKTVNTGLHNVGEIAGSVGVLGNYQKSIECKDQNGTGSVVASVGADSAGPLDVTVGYGDDIVCTITNTRETGKLEVVKDLNPSTDSGTFNLQIDGTTEKANATDGDSTGEKTLNTGLHNVGEIAGNSGALADYQKSIECKDNNGTGSVVATVGPDSAGPLNVTVGYGDDIVCTITNVRETGKLEVVKDLNPSTDPGRFNLQIDGTTQKANAGDGGTTGEKTLNTGLHNVGEVAGTYPATNLGNYQKSIECVDDNGEGDIVAQVGPDSAGPLDVTVGYGDDIVCTITNTRETGKLEVVKSLSPTNDPGRFNLQIDGATQKTDAANGDSTGEKTVNTGLHNVGEIAGSVGVLGNYQKSIECKDQNGTGSVVASVGADSAGPLDVTVGYQDDIVCTVSNVRETGKLEVVKSLSPTNDPGRFNLQIDGATQKTDAANGDSTGEKTVNTGLHNVGEIAGSVGVLGNYQKSIECKDQNGTGSVVASVGADSAGPLDVTVGYQDDIVCTVSNVRETGKLEVVKSLSPTNDPGRFNLQIDGATQKTDAANGDSTGEKTVNTGLHNVGEIAGSVGVLGNYQKSIECKDQNGTGSVVASVGADSAGPLDVTVGYGDDIVCTITNTRETGKLEVVKDLNPSTDSGTFNLQIDGTTEKANATDGDSTGEKTLNTGLHNVGEIAGNSGALADYQKSIECKDNNGTGSVVATVGPDSAGPLNVTVGYGDDIVCTITNVRETGKLEVVKDLNPSTDPGRFNLQIDGTTQKANAGDGGTTGEKTLNTGLHNVGEVAGTYPATNLGNYQKSIECVDDNGEGDIVAQVGPDSAGPLDVTVGYGDDIVCTITNTRETGKLEVVKDLNPSTDSGTFNLQIDGTTEKANATDGDSTGEKTLNTGLHNVGEIAGNSGALADYQKSIECKDQNGTGSVVASVGADSAGPLNVTVGYGDDIVCTITNTRETGKLEVVKDLNPSTDPGRFNLQIDGTTQKTDAGDGDSTGEKTVNTGLHNVGEIAGTNPVTSLAKYDKSIECRRYNGTGSVVASATGAGPLNVTVNYGDDIVCTITNTRIKGKLTVKKALVPSTDSGRFDLSIDTTLVADDVGDNGSGYRMLDPGTYSVTEAAGTTTPATVLSNYDRSVICKTSGGTTVASNITGAALNVDVDSGDDITCTFTNKRRPTLIVQKVIKPTGSATSFEFQTGPSGSGYSAFSLAGGQQNSQILSPGDYTAKEIVPLGWVLTGIGGSSSDPLACTVSGSGGSTGSGNLSTQTVSVTLKYGDTVTCVFENTGQGVTRTQGFWATHPQLAHIAWFGGADFGHNFGSGVAGVGNILDITLCTRPIDTDGKLMGGFWSSVSKTSGNKSRSKLDQARMQLLQQLLAAELNASAFGSQPSSGSFTAWESAFCGTSESAIQTAMQQAASFNTAGDSGQFTPGTSADSKAARAIADLVFWDKLPAGV